MNAWDIVRGYQGYVPEDMQGRLETEIEIYASDRVKEALEKAYTAARGTDKLKDPKFTRNQMYWKGRADAAHDIRQEKIPKGN